MYPSKINRKYLFRKRDPEVERAIQKLDQELDQMIAEEKAQETEAQHTTPDRIIYLD